MLFKRESGILLHPTSLPGPHGIGELGGEALRFVDTLAAMRQSIWQVLPLTPPGTAFSPYQGGSSFAGNTWLLSVDRLDQRGLLEPLESSVLERLDLGEGRVDFEAVIQRKVPLLRHAAAQFLATAKGSERDHFDYFRHQQDYWLRDYARYQALQRAHHGTPWFAWSAELRRRHPSALDEVDRSLESAILVECALQYLFEVEWHRVRAYANQLGIRILGDLPIFVSHDSADVWAAQHLFQLDKDGNPRVVAGVPPDYFSKTGQRWGNPLYDWEQHEAENFEWWTRRVRRTLEMTDLLRIDHFRGFAACWEIPADELTAINGRWVPSPGVALFKRLQAEFDGHLPIVAEDLGIITEDVDALRDSFDLPTMRVLQFSFGGEEKLLPHNYPVNCVAYTGTHDNDTTVGWYGGPSSGGLLELKQHEVERDRVRRYYNTDGTDIQWTCMNALLNLPCAAVIFPLQDVLGLDSRARMNTPGTVGEHNWTWRFSWEQLEERMVKGLEFITREAGRNEHLPCSPV